MAPVPVHAACSKHATGDLKIVNKSSERRESEARDRQSQRSLTMPLHTICLNLESLDGKRTCPQSL